MQSEPMYESQLDQLDTGPKRIQYHVAQISLYLGQAGDYSKQELISRIDKQLDCIRRELASQNNSSNRSTI